MSEAPYTIIRSNSEPQSSEFILDSYIMHRKDTRCTRCASISTTSETFEVQVHPTRGIRRLVPAKSLSPGFSIGLSTLQVKEQPCCFICYDTLPQEERGAQYLSEDEWRNTLRRKYARPETGTAKVASKEGPSLEDL
jgi:hypothetical protein